LELGDRQQVVEVTQQGRRYVIAGGAWRQQRDQERRAVRLAKAEAALKHLAGAGRKKVNAQKLASQAGRLLERLKAHKYFTYHVNPQGRLAWERKAESSPGKPSGTAGICCTPTVRRRPAARSRCWPATRACWKSRRPFAS
jgi:hypothetical protein